MVSTSCCLAVLLLAFCLLSDFVSVWAFSLVLAGLASTCCGLAFFINAIYIPSIIYLILS